MCSFLLTTFLLKAMEEKDKPVTSWTFFLPSKLQEICNAPKKDETENCNDIRSALLDAITHYRAMQRRCLPWFREGSCTSYYPYEPERNKLMSAAYRLLTTRAIPEKETEQQIKAVVGTRDTLYESSMLSEKSNFGKYKMCIDKYSNNPFAYSKCEVTLDQDLVKIMKLLEIPKATK